MNKVGFAIVKLWIDFLSVHPYWLLHLKSDCLRFLAYHVVRYRRKVVRENLVRAFPDKDLEAIKASERRFYRNLFDVVMETPKLLHPKNDCFDGRVTITNPEMIVRLQEQGKSLFYAIPHSGNWEWF